MKLLSQREIKTKKGERAIGVKDIATGTQQKLQEYNILKLDVEKKKLALVEELNTFSEGVFREKTALLKEIEALETRKEEAKKPIEITLEHAKTKEKEAKKALEEAKIEREKSEKLAEQANEYLQLVQLFLMEVTALLTAMIDELTVEKSVPHRITQMKELLVLVEEVKKIRDENKVLMDLYKQKIDERTAILNALIEENNKEKDKIAKEKKHIESQQQSIKTALTELKNKTR